MKARWWRWVASETRRSFIALALAVAVTLPVRLIVGSEPAGSYRMGMSLLAVFLFAYVALSVFLLRSSWELLRPWAEESREPTWRDRYIRLSEPGAGLAVMVSFIALLASAAVVSGRAGAVGVGEVVAAVLVVVASWLAMLFSFSLDYLRTNGRRGWGELDFPGVDDPAKLTGFDFLYFAAAVSTTFGTTDVTVVSPSLRRTVALHGVVAFVFNTVILAVTISSLAS